MKVSLVLILLFVIFLGCERESEKNLTVVSSTGSFFEVCLDQNGNEMCDIGEPVLITGDNGSIKRSQMDRYSDAENLIVVSIEGVETVYYIAGWDSEIVSPISTLKFFHSKAGYDVDHLKSLLGIKELNDNYTVSREWKLKKTAQLYEELFKTYRAKGFLPYDAAVKSYEMIVENSDMVLSGGTTVEKKPEPYIANPLTQTFRQGFVHGVGINALSGELAAINSCLKSKSSVKTAEANQTLFSMDVVTSVEDFLKSLEIELRISFNSINVSGGIYGKFKDITSKNSNSIFVAVKIVTRIADYSLENVELTDEAKKYYTGDYDVFREKCGDLFLSTISTGGAYIGILEIKTASAYEKLYMEAALKGVYKPMGLEIEAALAYLNEKLSIVSNYTMHILTIGETGDVITDINSKGNDKILKTFIENGQKFVEKLYQNHERNKGVAANNFLARFEPYSQIIALPSPKETEAANRNEAISQYDALYTDYDVVLGKLKEILARPWDYEKGKEKESELLEIESDVEWFLANLKTVAVMCGKEKSSCLYPTDFIEKSSVVTAREIERFLPEIKTVYPKNCKERKEAFVNRNSEDIYTLFMGNDKDKPFTVYCDNMDEDNPDGYLVLENFSPLPPPESYASFVPRYNFSSKQNHTGSVEDKEKIITVYRKIRVVINHNNLTIVPYQDKFLETIVLNSLFDAHRDVEHISLGRASVCGSALVFDSENNSYLQAASNINVSGTPFCFPENKNKFYVPDRTNDLEIDLIVECSSNNDMSVILSNNGNDDCIKVQPVQDILMEYCEG